MTTTIVIPFLSYYALLFFIHPYILRKYYYSQTDNYLSGKSNEFYWKHYVKYCERQFKCGKLLSSNPDIYMNIFTIAMKMNRESVLTEWDNILNRMEEREYVNKLINVGIRIVDELLYYQNNGYEMKVKSSIYRRKYIYISFTKKPTSFLNKLCVCLSKISFPRKYIYY